MSDTNKKGRNRLMDIFRYHRDELSGEERNTFERELQKDPFTEEAVEGLSSLTEEEALKDIYDLGSRIKTKTGRRIRFNFYRIAASIAVLMVISSIFIFIEKNNNGKHLAVNTAQPETLEIAKIKPVTKSINAEQPSEKQVGIPDKMTDKSVSRKSVNSQQKEEQPSEKQVDIQDEIRDNPVSGKSIISQQPVTAPLNAMTNARSLKSKEFEAKADSQIQVNPDSSISALSEVVVVGYDSKKAEAENKDYNPPLPVGGKTKFDTYIRDNLHRPDTSISDRRVVVVVSFLVHIDGSLDSIRVNRSPGKFFSDEAIRVIKSGPGWKPAEVNGTKTEDTVSVRIVFR